MGISSLRAWILAASLLSVCAVANAAGLGRLNVMSALGDPLNAEIELVAEKNEIGSLAARLADPEAFDRAGLIYPPSLADIKVSIEKRASGEPYIRLTSTQPQNDPFLDLLVELSWASGRISRQFTALLDPPFLIAEREQQRAAEAEVRAAQSVPAPEAEPMPEPEPMPETAAVAPDQTAPAATESPVEEAATEPAEPVSIPEGPVETIGGTAPTLFDATPSASMAAGADYGPVKRGDTLTQIARASKPADVSLEQMLVLLFRSNPEAFAGNNMNRLKTGRIIRMPSAEQYASLPEAEARREVRVQAQDWNAYREKLAIAAGQSVPAEDVPQQAATGKVTTTVADPGAAQQQQPKEVVKLSKGEPSAPGTAAPATDNAAAQARVRALEEELVARDKAVKEAGERVARLEKTITDLQALLEIKNKGMADLQKPAAPAPAPDVAQPATPAAPATPAKPPAAPVPGPEAKPAPAPTPAVPSEPEPKSEAAPPQAQPAAPKPRPPRPAPMPPPEPSLVDQVLDNLPYVGAGLGVLVLLGALAVRAVKRRRESKSDSEESGPARTGAAVAAGSAGAAFSGTETDLSIANARAAKDIAEEVDPVAEAEIFMAYGRDGQAEELLKEALAAAPARHEVSLKLLQIYAKRKDAKAFEQTARELQQGTGGSGEIWDQAARLGYQVDPGNPRYAAGRPTGDEAGVPDDMSAGSSAAENVDFNIGVDDPAATTATDIDLGDGGGSDLDKTQIFNPGELAQGGEASAGEPAMAMDLNLDLPDTETASETGGGSIDFEINLDNLPAATEAGSGEPAAPTTSSGSIDFDMGSLSMEPAGEPKVGSGAVPEIDLSGISLDLGTETTPQTSPTGKDDHWYDVQTKFDLAKAYQEMGDKDGARDILKEVLQEGDAEQKSAAQAVLASLDT